MPTISKFPFGWKKQNEGLSLPMPMLKRLSFFILLLSFFSCHSGGGKLRAPVKVKGKYGYIDETGSFIVDPKFDEAWSFIRGSAIVKEKGKYGMIGKDGAYIIVPKFDSVIPFSASCCIFEKDSLFGVMANGSGAVIMQPQFERVFYYTEKLCVVQKGKALGIVNSEGKMVCPLVMQDFHQMFGPAAIAVQQDTSDEVSMLLALIQGGGGSKLGLINRNGELIVQPKYDEIFDDLPMGYYYPFLKSPDAPEDTVLSDGPAPVPPGKYGIIDTTGKIICEPQFEELPVYGDGMFRVRIGEKYGYANEHGTVVIAPAYDYAVAFSEGKAIVSKGSKSSIIDKSGKVLVADLGPGGGIYRFHSGLARCRSLDGQYGFLDETGKRVIPPQFDVADDFDNNRAIVSLNNQYGLIGKDGKFVIEPKYDFIFNLGDGFYQTKDAEGKAGVVDSLGHELLPPVYDEVFHLQKPYFAVEQNMLNGCFSITGKQIYPPVSVHSIYFFNGRCIVSDNGKNGIIDSLGQFILPAQYDSIGVFFKGYATITQNNRFGAIDSTGKIIIAPQFDELRPVVNGFAVYRSKDKFGYVDKNGEVVIGAAFEDAAVLLDPDRKEFE